MGMIYVLRNRVNGKCYVGQTTRTLVRRLSEHGCSRTQVIGRAMQELGKNRFESFMLLGVPQDLMDHFEKELISRLKSRIPDGYNVDGGGVRTRINIRGIQHPMFGRKGESNPWFGRKHSAETKQKISMAMSGKLVGSKNPMYGKAGPSLGKHFSEEHKKRISEALLGRKHSPERIEKNRLSHLRKVDR